MSSELPPGQEPIDPRGAFTPPSPTPPRPGTTPPLAPPGAMPPSGAYPPPGGAMPPGMMPMYYPPPPRRRGAGKNVIIAVLLILLVLSVMLNLVLLVGGAMLAGRGDGAQKRVVADGDDRQRIAVLSVSGTIMDSTAQSFDRVMRQVERDKAVKALVIEVDTPGGTVAASDLIYHRIQSFKRENPGIPVVISQGAMATSGGYYISCAGTHILAQPTTMTGNIGVMLPRYNLSKLAERWGIEDATLHSTGSDFKTAGSMFRPEEPEERAYLQHLIDSAFAQFKAVVETGRPKVDFARVGNGKVFVASEALALGLIDQIGYPEDAYQKAASLASLNNPKVVRYENPPSLWDILWTRSSVSPANAQTVNVNGVNVTVDGKQLADWLTPRAMYLWIGQ